MPPGVTLMIWIRATARWQHKYPWVDWTWEVDIGINWGAQASSEGGDHVTVPARWSDFLFFKRSRNSRLLHEIFPFLNMAQIHKPPWGSNEICLLVTIGSQPSLWSCSLACQAPSHLSSFAVLFARNDFFCFLAWANLRSFKNNLTPHFLSGAFLKPPRSAFPMHPEYFVHVNIHVKTVISLCCHCLLANSPQVVLCPGSSCVPGHEPLKVNNLFPIHLCSLSI